MSKEDVEEILEEMFDTEYMTGIQPNLNKDWLRSKLTPLVAQKGSVKVTQTIQHPDNVSIYTGGKTKLSPILSQAPVEEKCGYMILTPTPIHNGGMWCAEKTPCKEHGDWKKDWPPKFVLTTTASKKEQKEGVGCCSKCAMTPHISSGCPCHTPPTPTPTVKEESHTQGWEEKAAMLRQRHYDERIMRERETKAFEAGRLQGIADAVAVVPKAYKDGWISYNHPMTSSQMVGWNNCRQAMLTALSSLTHKRPNHE